MAQIRRAKLRREAAQGAGAGAVALIYFRISGSERQKEGFSLEAQLADDRRYCAARAWAIAGEFSDVLTGRRDDRPGYLALLEEARRLAAEGRRVVIVVKWLHRLGRKVLEAVRSREELQALGVAVHSVMEGGEVSDLQANIMASVAEYEVDQLGERVSEVMQHSREEGWHVAGALPWGYRRRPATKAERDAKAQRAVLDVAPAEAPFVVEAFRRVASGATVRSVAAWASILPAEARGGRKLTLPTLQKLLRRPLYIARHEEESANGVCWDPARALAAAPARWPALIDDATWMAVQDRFATWREQPRREGQKHLLTGLLVCPRCEGRMVGRLQHGRAPRYACPAGTHARTSPGLGTAPCWYTVAAGAVEAQVLEAVGGRLAALASLTAGPDAARLRPRLERAWEALRRERRGAGAGPWAAGTVRRAEAARDRATKRLGDAATMLVDGVLDKAGYEAMREPIERDLAEAEAALRAARQRPPAGQSGTPRRRSAAPLPPLVEALVEVEGWAGAIERADVPAQRELLATLLERLVPTRTGHGRYAVEVHWTATGEALGALTMAATLH